MKIAYLVHEFPPEHVGGMGVATFQIAEGMHARGHKVWVLAPEPWVGDDLPSLGFFDEKVDGLSVRRLLFNPDLAPNPVLYEYYNPILSKYAEDFLRDISPDIVHICHLIRLSGSIIDIAKELRIPVVLTLADSWFFCPNAIRLKSNGNLCAENSSWKDCIYCLKEDNYQPYDRITRALNERTMESYVQERISGGKFEFSKLNNGQIHSLLLAQVARSPFLRSCLEKVDQIICPSSFLSKVYLKKGYFPNGFKVLTHGTICPTNLPLRKGPGSDITFGYFGGGRKVKGAHVLVEAFRQIDSPNVNLKLYGDFPNTKFGRYLRGMANGDERIEFMGNFGRTELIKVLADIDILVVPSICYENYPLSILEALANFVPVIATDVGGIPEIVRHGHNGLLFRRGDVSDLKDRMEQVVNAPGLIQKFRENILQVKSVDEECDELLGIYTGLLREG